MKQANSEDMEGRFTRGMANDDLRLSGTQEIHLLDDVVFERGQGKVGCYKDHRSLK